MIQSQVARTLLPDLTPKSCPLVYMHAAMEADGDYLGSRKETRRGGVREGSGVCVCVHVYVRIWGECAVECRSLKIQLLLYFLP